MYCRQNRISKYILIPLAGLLISLLSACSGGGIGYGVVLLSPDSNALMTGSFITVKEKSEINNTYKIEQPGSQQIFEIDTWRVAVYEKESEARARAEAYNEYETLFARNLRDGLAIREEPSINSNRVYKLRKGQEIKIIEKSEVQEKIGGHDGVWYRVLTKDGVQGYAFDYYLKIFDSTDEAEEAEGPDLSPLRTMLERTYRPESYKSMREKQQVKLDRFTSEYGLFSDLENNTITIRFHNNVYEFEYDEILRLSEKRYAFPPADLELIIRSDDVIQAVFTQEDKTYDPTFVYFDSKQLQEIREQERERRSELFESLIENGPLFTSNAYGEIQFSEEQQFAWSNLDRLVPSIIPDTLYKEGRIRLDHFLNSDLRSEYTGVLAFHFDQAPATPVLFLYSLDGRSLKLEYVSQRNVDDRVVQQRSSSRLIMAFFGESPD